MGATRSSERAMVVHLLREALGTVCTPEMRDRILSDALARAQSREVPSTRDRLGPFVSGPFRSVLEERIGGSVADAVIAELQELLVASAPAANEVSVREVFESHPRLKQQSVETIPAPT